MLSPSPFVKHTEVVTADWLEMVSTDTQVMHGQAVIAGTRVRLARFGLPGCGHVYRGITAEYPTVTVPVNVGWQTSAGCGAPSAHGPSGLRGHKPDEEVAVGGPVPLADDQYGRCGRADIQGPSGWQLQR
jgi:uncharacterized protein (DUF433 family)